jgi:hypothetical protein
MCAVLGSFRKHTGKASSLLAFALTLLAGALPVSAHTIPASQSVAADRLFGLSLPVVALVSTGEFPSIGTDLVLRAEQHPDRLVFAAVPSETDALDLLTDRRDTPSENGTQGVRRFILLAILFGAALRYLTSSTFYEWAADVFDPLGGY